MDDFGHMVIRTLTGFVNRLKISTGAEFQLGYSYRGKMTVFWNVVAVEMALKESSGMCLLL